MTVGIGAGGIVGIAFETVAGTYVAPTKFFPIISENIKYTQENNWRKPIRGLADVIGVVTGYSSVGGDITMELLPDVLMYFIRAGRTTTVKTGSNPYTYVTTPSHAATFPDKTLSITVVRNGVAFGYVGVNLGSFEISQNNAVAQVKLSLMGLDEATQSVPSSTFANQVPFGAGMYSIQVPTASQIFDVDSFTFSVDDHIAVQNRLASTRAAAFTMFGERDVKIHMDRDFTTRTEYDTFKALTAGSVTIALTNGGSAAVTMKAAAAIRDTWDIGGLSGQGNLLRAGIDWVGTYDTGTSKSYELTVISTENIT